jgi:hypothetical protein
MEPVILGKKLVSRPVFEHSLLRLVHLQVDFVPNPMVESHDTHKHDLYRSTVFWTPSDLKLGCISQDTPLLMSHLSRCFVSMPSNQPGFIVLTLELVQRQAEFFHAIKGREP